MARLVFGPKTSGITILGLSIGVTIQVFQDAGDPPQCFTVSATSPLGNSSSMSLSDGRSMSLDVIPGELAVKVETDDWNAKVSPGFCQFKVVLRATGHVPHLPIPINVQIDAYDVVLHTTMQAFADFIDASVARQRSAPAGRAPN